jgi:hypothetical protein
MNGVSDRVIHLVCGYLTALLTRGAPIAPSARQLAHAVGKALDLGVRTVQRAFRDDRVADLVAQLVGPVGTPAVPVPGNPQVTGLPPHPDDDGDTDLLLGDSRLSSAAPGSRFHKRQQPNEHPGYCVDCGRWVESEQGAISIPYPQDSRVIVRCSEHAVLRAMALTLEDVKL